MITRSKQNWEAGSVVQVGFMKLVVIAAVPTPGDYAPDEYLLRSAKGEHYSFVPHKGLTKIDARSFEERRALAA